jgi:hypothetical protein
MSNLPLCTVAALITTQKGPIIGIFHQYTHYGKGNTIHSVNWMKQFCIIIDDTPCSLSPHGQTIQTLDGYLSLSHQKWAPAHMGMYIPTNGELDMYPHVMFTPNPPWNPCILDNE